MRRGLVPLLALLALAAAASAGAVPDATSEGSAAATGAAVPGELIVGFEPGAAAGARSHALSAAGVTRRRSFGPIDAALVSVAPQRSEQALEALRHNPNVRYAEPNFRLSASALPNDARFGELWGLNNVGQSVNGWPSTADADIDAPEAWALATASPSVTVAAIDTGVDFSHEDLGGSATASPVMWTNPGETCNGCSNNGVDDDANGLIDDWRGWDWKNNDNNPADDNGHGTHVTGTIAATGNNGVGVIGVAPGVRVMSLKFLGADGTGDVAGAVAAILYAAAFHAPVLNGSFGGNQHSQALADSIGVADALGSLYVAAAGNSLANTDVSPNFPSVYEISNIVAVAATEGTDGKAWFSSYGAATVDLGAPGQNILSTWLGNTYQYSDGTSMAAPYVSGAVALLKSKFPAATAVGLKALILRSVDVKSSLVGKTRTGGRLNLANAASCSAAPKVWIDAPAPGFAGEVGKPIPVRVIGSICGVPAGASLSVTAGGQPVTLSARGDGLYTGSFTPSTSGGVTLVATASAGGATDTMSSSGTIQAVYPITPGGPPVTVTTTAANENAKLAFNGEAGKRISLKLSGVTITNTKVSILNPDGSTLVSPTTIGTSGGFIDAKSLATTGSYSILVDPQASYTGSMTLTLYDVPPDSGVGAAMNGQPATVTTTTPGQNAWVVFDGVAGHRLSFTVSGVTMASGKVTLYRPNGAVVVGPTLFGTSGAFLEPVTLPVTSTYYMLIDPQTSSTGSATVNLNDVPPDVVGSITAGGAPVNITLTTPGQNALLTFSGISGRRISLIAWNVALQGSYITILDPNGGNVVNRMLVTTSGAFVEPRALPVTGTYAIVVDGQSAYTGSLSLTLYDVPPDVTGTLVPGGAPLSVSLTAPGQNARVTFSGTAGRHTTVTLSGVTIGTSSCCSAKVSIVKPDNSNLVAPTYFGRSGKTLVVDLPVAGTYTIVVDPQSTSTGGATITVT
jgi:subtilisin family serine protease